MKLNEKEWINIGKQKTWIRNCPCCDKKIITSNEKYYIKSTKENKICISCALKKSHKNKGHISNENKKNIIVKCPNCGLPRSYYRTILNDRLCKSCAAKNQYDNKKIKLISGLLNKNKNTKTNKKKVFERFCPKCNRIIKHPSLHYVNKNKHRWCKSCACKENLKKNNINFPFVPSFNPNACKIIDEYGNKNGYNFRHALNGGEVYFKELGYWIDGYDNEKNVVIECYEPFHYNHSKILNNKDVYRRNDIIKSLQCRFIEIKYDGKCNVVENINIYES